MENKELKLIADAMLEKKGQDVVSLDLRPIGTAISDHFIVCNADSTPAVVAIADNIEDSMVCSTQGFPIHHQLLELTQTVVR